MLVGTYQRTINASPVEVQVHLGPDGPHERHGFSLRALDGAPSNGRWHLPDSYQAAAAHVAANGGALTVVSLEDAVEAAAVEGVANRLAEAQLRW